MTSTAFTELARRVASVDRRALDRAGLRAYLADLKQARSWIDAAEADAIALMRVTESYVEQAVSEAEGVPFHKADKLVHRAALLTQLPSFAAALAAGHITGAHVDVVVRALKRLEPGMRPRLLADADRLVGVAARMTADSFQREVKRSTAKYVDEMARYQEQLRATSLRTWVDPVTDMWCLHAEFDPVTGKVLASILQGKVEAMFRDTTPPNAPTDPLMRQHHLAALALAELLRTPGSDGKVQWRVGVNIDLSDGPMEIDWGLPIDVPRPVVAALLQDALIDCVIVANGRVLHAPGRLDEGRDKRVATRAQRRALNAMYRGCGMPGCTVHFERAKVHHIVPWEHGGLTNLDNLLPLCPRHHHAVHDKGWVLELGPNRELTVRLPDGQVLSTGPPSRRRPAA